MKSLAETFLNAAERKKIEAAVKNAEKKTAGEIVPMVVSSSYHYPMADVLGAVTITLPVAILLTWFVGGLLWIGPSNMWLFMGIFGLVFVLSHLTIKRVLPLKRVFVSDREMTAEVSEAALTGFYSEGLYRTRDETGVLIFISVFEHKVWVLADRGINAKVSQDQWESVVTHIVDGIKRGRACDAVCEAVGEVGQILAAHFPVRENDVDELKNLIVEEKGE